MILSKERDPGRHAGRARAIRTGSRSGPRPSSRHPPNEQVDEVVFAYSDLSPRGRDARHRSRSPPAPTSVSSGRLDDVRARSRSSPCARCPHRLRQEPDQPRVGAAPARRRTEGRAGASSDAVRRPRAMRVQRFATLEDIDASHPTIEEREEYERPSRMGMVVYAGVDYGAILGGPRRRPTSIIWDGGNNDFSFYLPTCSIAVVDPLRAGPRARLPPGRGEPADGRRRRRQQGRHRRRRTRSTPSSPMSANVEPTAAVIRAASPVTLEAGPSLAGKRVLVIDDGPTITHGGMSFGAGTVAARKRGATVLGRSPALRGRLDRRDVRTYPHIDRWSRRWATGTSSSPTWRRRSAPRVRRRRRRHADRSRARARDRPSDPPSDLAPQS